MSQLLNYPLLQATCERLLSADTRLMYSGYLDDSGEIIAEATRDSISNYERLKVMLLPMNFSKGSIVIAVPPGSDVCSIVETTKKILQTPCGQIYSA
jgi:hypothetical protein